MLGTESEGSVDDKGQNLEITDTVELFHMLAGGVVCNSAHTLKFIAVYTTTKNNKKIMCGTLILQEDKYCKIKHRKKLIHEDLGYAIKQTHPLRVICCMYGTDLMST